MPLKLLPFASHSDDGKLLSMWNVSPSGDYEQDTATGRAHFEALSGAILATGNPLLLSRVVEGQVASGKWTGIEVGFAAAMSEAAAHGI